MAQYAAVFLGVNLVPANYPMANFLNVQLLKQPEIQYQLHFRCIPPGCLKTKELKDNRSFKTAILFPFFLLIEYSGDPAAPSPQGRKVDKNQGRNRPHAPRSRAGAGVRERTGAGAAATGGGGGGGGGGGRSGGGSRGRGGGGGWGQLRRLARLSRMRWVAALPMRKSQNSRDATIGHVHGGSPPSDEDDILKRLRSSGMICPICHPPGQR